MGCTNKSDFNSDLNSHFKSCSKSHFNEVGFNVLNPFYATPLNPSPLTNQLGSLTWFLVSNLIHVKPNLTVPFLVFGTRVFDFDYQMYQLAYAVLNNYNLIYDSVNKNKGNAGS